MRWIPASRGERVAFLTLLGVVVLLAVVPVGRLAQEALAPGGKIDPALLAGVLENPAVWRAARNTLTVSLGGVVLAVMLGGAFALLVTLTDLRGKKPLVFCFMLPLMIAPQVTALAWIDLFGPNSTLLGALGLAPPPGTRHPLYGPEGIILLLGIEYAPVVFLTVRAGLRALPRDLVESAQWSLGRWRRPVEVACWSAFAVALILPFLALLATALVPAIGVPLDAGTVTLANFHFVLLDYAATRRAFINSASLSATAAMVLVFLSVALGYSLKVRRAVVLGAVAFSAEFYYAVSGELLAIALL